MASSDASSLQLYLRLLGNVRPYWVPFALSIAGMVVTALTEPVVPALLKPLLDGSFVHKEGGLLAWLPALIVGIFLVRGVASYASDYAIGWVANKVVMDLRNAMFAKLVRLPTYYYDNHTSGGLVSKFTFDVLQLTGAATSVVSVLFRDSLTIVALLGYLFFVNWKLTLVAVLVGPPAAAITRAFSVRLRTMSRAEQAAMGDLNHALEESIGCHRVVKVFGGQEYEAKRFDFGANKVRRFNMKMTSAAAANVPLVQIIVSIALAVIIYIAVRQATAGNMTVGDFVSFLTALLLIFQPLKRLTGVNQSLQRGLAAAENVFRLIDEKSEADSGTRDIPRAKGEIEFRQVEFTYPGSARPAIDRVSFSIHAGETVALVGGSGAGKSTLANLLPRFYSPDSGQILLDGVDIATLKLASLRANIALVSQDIVLFNDTVAANIAYGRLAGTSEAEVVRAAEAAHAMQFIREMSDGLATLIGENGVRLSGGQRQRLAIARAFLKNAPVLILDEATSALDSESERHVQEALEKLMKGRTTLVIAHRLSTIERADRIVVLDEGRVAETGRHADLIAASGIYAKLHRLQYSHEAATG
ncbi:MAG TPA: lipid A export permease/ATP-binding protein MsbA [Burkholderiales bacterium]|nr:lipid A export permease/ATP-binding protein MsbA [Burkholderiales bacterium]